MSKAFASTGDTGPKKVSFSALGDGLFAYTAEGDPNTGVIVGDDSCMVIDAQATPQMAQEVVARVKMVTDKPIKYVLLSHYHAVRVLGASGFKGAQVFSSEQTRKMIVERGEQDKASEIGRFPRLFKGVESVPPGLTWPHFTFKDSMTLWLGRRRVDITHLGRGHTAGDTIAWVPDQSVMFSGDLVEYKSACYCGDAHFADWPKTLDKLSDYKPRALVPGRGDALTNAKMVAEAVAGTRAFLTAQFEAAQTAVHRAYTLKQAFKLTRDRMDQHFSSYAIYEHCLPFNVSRAYDEARGIDWPTIWTDARDQEMWKALQG